MAEKKKSKRKYESLPYPLQLMRKIGEDLFFFGEPNPEIPYMAFDKMSKEYQDKVEDAREKRRRWYQKEDSPRAPRYDFKKGGEVKKTKTDKIVDFLGGPAATKAELMLMGIGELYNLLGMPLPFANGGAVGSPPVEPDLPTTPLPTTQVPFYFNPQTQDELGLSTYTDFAQRGTRIEDLVRPSEVGIGIFGQYGNLSGGIRAPFTGPGSIGEPEFQLRYQRQFADGGGVESGPPPKRGPLPQGLETLFETR